MCTARHSWRMMGEGGPRPQAGQQSALHMHIQVCTCAYVAILSNSHHILLQILRTSVCTTIKLGLRFTFTCLHLHLEGHDGPHVGQEAPCTYTSPRPSMHVQQCLVALIPRCLNSLTVCTLLARSCSCGRVLSTNTIGFAVVNRTPPPFF